MERPRVLILGKLPPPIMGPAIATEIILNSSLSEDFELHHFDTRISHSVSEMGKLRLSKITDLQSKYRAFRNILKEVQPNLVLIPISQTSAGFFKDVPFIRLAAISKAKVLLHLRGSAFKTWYDRLDVFRKKMVAKNLSKADGIIVLGENLRFIFSDFYSERDIYVVPNGRNFNFPERRLKQLQITYIGNYLPGKGIKEVIEAIIILNQSIDLPRFYFQAYGAWDNLDYRKTCENLAERNDNIFLNDSIEGEMKWQVLADSDVFVFTPNHPEGHPWSLVEASAAGLPIIATDRGAISQNVHNEINGYLLSDPDPYEIADRLKQLITDENLRIDMGRASRDIYEEKFTAEAMVSHLNFAFKSILDLCVES